MGVFGFGSTLASKDLVAIVPSHYRSQMKYVFFYDLIASFAFSAIFGLLLAAVQTKLEVSGSNSDKKDSVDNTTDTITIDQDSQLKLNNSSMYERFSHGLNKWYDVTLVFLLFVFGVTMLMVIQKSSMYSYCF